MTPTFFCQQYTFDMRMFNRRKPVCLSAFLPICPFVCLSVHQSVCLPAFLPICLSAHQSVCLPFFLSVHLSVCLPISLSVCLSSYLFVCPSVFLSVCLSFKCNRQHILVKGFTLFSPTTLNFFQILYL